MNNTNIMASRGTKGGLARATILSKNRRIEIAKLAAFARFDRTTGAGETTQAEQSFGPATFVDRTRS